jgi:hemerythrin superfamily protein
MRRNDSTSRNIAMLMGGVAAGVMAGRVLPSLLAMLSGSQRARSGSDPFAQIITDHRRILKLLDEMAATGRDAGMNRTRLFLRLKRKLAKHALAEEDVVYPIVTNGAAAGKDRKHLYDEHADMKILLYEIERKIHDREDWSQAVLQLRSLIRAHVDEEERTIFPELRRQLGQENLPGVAGQISREEALIV